MVEMLDFSIWVLGLYILATAVVGVLIFREAEPSSFSKRRTTGPCLWGVYKGVTYREPDSLKIIEFPEPTKGYDIVVGSGMYAKGRAVKSPRG